MDGLPGARGVDGMSGTLALSWGPSGGFYLHPRRICLGRVALTYVPNFEVDDMMEAVTSAPDICMERDMWEAFGKTALDALRVCKAALDTAPDETHQKAGEACGIDACALCWAQGTVEAALLGEGVPPRAIALSRIEEGPNA
jgi:hypothetical protein